MINYFIGSRKDASRWMRSAEAQGVYGDDGLEHPLAEIIYSRERW